MKVVVEREKCPDHGQCVLAAPEVFQLDENGKLVHESEFGEGPLGKVEEAADVCPTQAITIED